MDEKQTARNGSLQEIRTFEEVLKEANNFGPFQRWQFFLLTLTVIPIALSFMSIPLLAGVPGHRCAIPSVDGLTNVSLEKRLNATIPREPHAGTYRYSQCYMYQRNYSNFTEEDIDAILNDFNYTDFPKVECTHGWKYDDGYFKSTVVTQWDLVCDKKVIVTVIESLYEAGKIIGTIVFGALSDRYGRKAILMVTLFVLFTTSTVMAFSIHVAMFIVLRFIQASACVFLISFVLINELCGPEWRNLVSQTFQMMWALAYMALAGIGYALQDWFHIELVIAASGLPFFFYYWLIPESPRWLYSVNRHDEGDELLKKIFERNDKKIPKNIQVVVTNEKPGNMADLFKTPNLRKWTLAIYFMWFANAMVYYGLTLNTGDLGGSPYLNFFISAALEVPAYILVALVLWKFGRRYPLCLSQLLGGAALICIIAVPHEYQTAATVLSQTGKFAISFSFGILFMYVIEIFPTAIRSIGLGSSAMAANIGGVVAPFIGDLGKFTSFSSLHFVVFGSCAVVAGILTLVLPETYNIPLPQTIEECENIGRKKDKSANSNATSNGLKQDEILTTTTI